MTVRTVFIEEAESLDGATGPGDVWLTGRFDGSLQDETRVLEAFEDLSLEEALAWGRARAARVLIRHGDNPWDHYSAGTEHPPDALSWPPADLPAFVRRRRPEERWRDRTGADEPIHWRVDVVLVPPRAREHTIDELLELRDAWAAEAARIAASARAVSWDADALDLWIADVGAAHARSGGEPAGWFTFGSVSLHLVLAVDAATAGHATAEAEERLSVPPGWRYEATAEPAT